MKLITKELTQDFKNEIEIKRKIRQLKDEFINRSYHKVENLYLILNKIYKLRKSLSKNYGIRSLEREGLGLNYVMIRYIFSYEFISTKSKHLVKEKKLTDSAVCSIIWRFKFLREQQWQDKLVNAYLKGRIKISEIGEFTTQELMGFLNGKKIKESDRYLISVKKTIISMTSRLKNKGPSIKKSPHTIDLRKAIKKLEGVLK